MIGVSLHSAIVGVPAAVLEGAVVALPRAAALERLRRLRSPAWAAVLPGSIVVGTFGLLLARWSAPALVLAAAITTPVLAALAVAFVVRGRTAMIAVALAAGAASMLATGAAGYLGSSVVTALACVLVGGALAALIPGRWLLAGVAAMAVVDAALLATGFAYHQTALLAAAATAFHGPQFTGARVGATTIGYPDLFLAALVGACLACDGGQRRAALLVVAFAIAFDSTLSRGAMLPATVPIAIALGLTLWSRRRPAQAAQARRAAQAARAQGAPTPGRAGRAGHTIDPWSASRRPISRCSSGSCRRPDATSSTSGAGRAPWSGP